MFTLIAIVVLPTIAAIMARFGLINNYLAATITYVLTNNIPVAVTVYLAVTLGNVVTELNGFSSDPDILGVCDMGYVQSRAPYNNLREVYTHSITKRLISMILSAAIFGFIFPKIPLLALPWWIYVLFFGALISNRNKGLYGASRLDLPFNIYATIAGMCWLLSLYFNYIEVPGNIVFISIAAISSMLSRYIAVDNYDEPPDFGHPVAAINWVTTLICAAVVWVVPGLTSASAARALSNQPNWALGMGGIDALLEGWTIGAWIFHGSLSGKTMLGAALQSWTFSSSLPVLPVCILSLAVAYSINLLLIRLIDPLVLDQPTLQILPLIIVFPITINVVCTIADPLGILLVLGMSVIVAVFGSRPALRGLVILFVTAS